MDGGAEEAPLRERLSELKCVAEATAEVAWFFKSCVVNYLFEIPVCNLILLVLGIGTVDSDQLYFCE
jgi:hypothetical protein